MNALRRTLGLAWVILGPAAVIFLIYEAYGKIMAQPTQDVYLPWIIIITILRLLRLAWSSLAYMH